VKLDKFTFTGDKGKVVLDTGETKGFLLADAVGFRFVSRAVTGTITVHKVVRGGETDLTKFCFTLDPDPKIGQVCADANGTAVFTNVPKGTYTIVETSVPNFSQTDNTCANGVTINKDQQTFDCTITNIRDTGDLQVHKSS